MKFLLSTTLLLTITHPFAAAVDAAKDAAKEKKDAAKAQKLIDRAVKAMGAKKALARARRTIMIDKGVYYGMGDGLPYEGRFVYDFAIQGRYRMEIQGQFVTVIDKDKGWKSVQGMVIDTTGQSLAVEISNYLVNYAMTLIPLTEPNKEFQLSTTSGEKVKGVPCDGIQVKRKGMPTLTILFSRKTGLVAKTSYRIKDPEKNFDEVTMTTVYGKYKKFDGVLHPASMTIFRDGEKYVESNAQSVTYPKKIDDSEFKKPKN